MKSKLMKLIMGSLLLGGLCCVSVQAEPLAEENRVLPDSIASCVEEVRDIDDYVPDGMISEPELAEATNHTRFKEWILEGADNDGVTDFLIDPYSCDGIKVMGVTIENEAGEEMEVDAIAYKLDTVAASYESFVSMDDAIANAGEFFLEVYDSYCTDLLLLMEELTYTNPEIFWLSGGIYVTITDISESYDEYWSGLYDRYCYNAKYATDMYCLLAIPDIGFDVRHELYANPTVIKNAINEMNSLVDSIVAGADGMDEISKVKYYNEWLTTHNELNTTYTTDAQVSEVFAEKPDLLNCLGALRGGTGENAPLSYSYATAFKVLCDAGHVTCNVIPGTAGSGTDKKTHAWNEVKIYKSYFAVDTAWNDITDKKNVALSGDESEAYLLVGGNTTLPVGNQNMTFWASHSAKKYSEVVEDKRLKISYLGANAYEAENLQYIQLSTTDNYVVLGYDNLPVISAEVGLKTGEDTIRNWRIYKENDMNNPVGYGGGRTNSMTFPASCAEPGVYYVQAHYAGALYDIYADIKITIVRFDDVKTGDWFKESVGWAVQNGITAGYTNTAFAPFVNCTRGQLVTFLWRFYGCPEPETQAMVFKDVAKGSYFYDAVLWASENGYVKGYTEDQFAPNVEVTRAELAAILWRIAGQPLPEVLPEEGTETEIPEVETEGKEPEEGTEGETPEVETEGKEPEEGTEGETPEVETEGKEPEEGTEGETTEEETEDEIVEEKTGFSDVSEEDWYYYAVYWAAENNITKGYSEDIFAPGATATRSEIVTFLYRAKDILQNS